MDGALLSFFRSFSLSLAVVVAVANEGGRDKDFSR